MIIATTGGFMNSVVELITVLVIFLFVLALTYYVTRWIAGYQKTKTAQGNLSVIEAIRISNNQYVHIIHKYVSCHSFPLLSLPYNIHLNCWGYSE